MRTSGVLPAGLGWPMSIQEVVGEFNRRVEEGTPETFRVIPLGFEPLDGMLGGGLMAGDLLLVGGPPGEGKTTFCLQAARHIARSGRPALLVCFEHPEDYLFQRLLCMESGVAMARLQRLVRRSVEESPAPLRFQDILEDCPALRQGWGRITEYWENLRLVRGDPNKTTVKVLAEYAARLWAGATPVLFVDYLQKVPVPPRPGVRLSPEAHAGEVVRGLKDLALDLKMPLVAVVAADREALKRGWVHLQDLAGGPDLEYECDRALLFNRECRLRPGVGMDVMVWSLEKNRIGPTGMMRMRFHGASFVFEPQGEPVGQGDPLWEVML